MKYISKIEETDTQIIERIYDELGTVTHVITTKKTEDGNHNRPIEPIEPIVSDREILEKLEQELAEVKKQSTATLMTSTDLGLNSATNMQTLLMTVTDLGLKLGELERQLKEIGVNE